MHQTLDTNRPKLDLREDAAPVPGRTATSWVRVVLRPAWSLSQVATAECACPADCIRDHENE